MASASLPTRLSTRRNLSSREAYRNTQKGVGAVAEKIRRAAADDDARFLFSRLFDDLLEQGSQPVGCPKWPGRATAGSGQNSRAR